MPIYDYNCTACGEQFELLVLKGATPACPTCGSERIEQQVSAFAVSSIEMTKARVASAREKYRKSSNVKDQKIAEAEDIKKHYEEGH
jgi:putative FmdB family regulatory protein